MTHDAALRSVQAVGRLPSVSAAVAYGGAEAWRGSVSVLEGISADTSYRIGSITKTMTAVLVLQLRDEGRLSLDDPVGRFVPEAGCGDVTLRGLLSHTAGLRSEPVGPWWERSPGVATAELLAANQHCARVASDGAYYHYSNLGYALLGETVARLRGRLWWDLVQERLLAPLGLTATTYDAPDDHAPGLSVDHFAHTLTSEPHADTVAMAPAGQLWSTVTDLLGWADFLAVGHRDVLRRETLAEMTRPATTAEGYGLGLRILRGRDRTLVGHTGSMPGFQASLFVDPTTRDAVAVLANATTGLRPELVPVELLGDDPVEECAPWRPSVEVPREIAPILGLWFWGNTALGFEWCGDELVVRDLRTGNVEYRFGLDEGVLVGTEGYHRGEPLEVRRKQDGSVSHLECASFVYTRVPYDPEVTIPGGHPA
ncbi:MULTISPECIES: serine hydrolase domain-containing protein [Nocardioides]|uniref:Serine hydrolase domain-containing protein n=1 Tax=Nocardioides vastitatis TaxID=2568655 RepID=A0ABW0ZIK5_9ACTN|nr:beta-lactamase family protein [Nocardioides sp.]